MWSLFVCTNTNQLKQYNIMMKNIRTAYDRIDSKHYSPGIIEHKTGFIVFVRSLSGTTKNKVIANMKFKTYETAQSYYNELPNEYKV